MKWFKHYTNASDDEFIAELEDEFGWEGYGRWWKLLEIIGQNMSGENGCSAIYPWSDWQRFLKGKRRKLEPFLAHLESKGRIKLKQNGNKPETNRKQTGNEPEMNSKRTGNKLEIECRKLLEIRDRYSKVCAQTSTSTAHFVRPKSKEIRVKRKEKQNPPFPPLEDFEEVWESYPNKIGKKQALKHFKATVKTDAHLQQIRTALNNYKQQVEYDRTREDGYLRQFQNGGTWFNNWQDWLEHKVDILENKWDRISREHKESQA